MTSSYASTTQTDKDAEAYSSREHLSTKNIKEIVSIVKVLTREDERDKEDHLMYHARPRNVELPGSRTLQLNNNTRGIMSAAFASKNIRYRARPRSEGRTRLSRGWQWFLSAAAM